MSDKYLEEYMPFTYDLKESVEGKEISLLEAEKIALKNKLFTLESEVEKALLKEEIDLLTEKINKPKEYFIRGLFSRADTPNKNKRVYSKKVMESVVKGLQEGINRGEFVGELDHPPTPKVNVDKIAVKVTEMTMNEDGSVTGEMKVLNTTQGKELKTLIDEGVRLGVSTRGTGSLKPYRGPLGEGLLEVQENYKMSAIDIVFNPSAGDDGRPNFVSESEEFEVDAIEIEDVISKVFD